MALAQMSLGEGGECLQEEKERIRTCYTALYLTANCKTHLLWLDLMVISSWKPIINPVYAIQINFSFKAIQMSC